MRKTVQVNGQIIDWEENLTVEKILKFVEVGSRLFIVKVNDEIVKKDQYGNKSVAPNSRVRVFPLLSGG